VEHAHNAQLELKIRPSDAHVAKGTHMVVVSEDIVLSEA
jgi:hypothetical protein